MIIRERVYDKENHVSAKFYSEKGMSIKEENVGKATQKKWCKIKKEVQNE